jgi:hypothetical protein
MLISDLCEFQRSENVNFNCLRMMLSINKELSPIIERNNLIPTTGSHTLQALVCEEPWTLRNLSRNSKMLLSAAKL